MDKDITLDGQRLHYTDTVEGARAIVMMHGWGCDHSTLALVERVAVACGYRVLNVDFPGFGLSPEPEEVWGVECYTRLIEKFVEAVGLTDYSLLGHSFGGRVGILMASRHPEVKKLVLVDAAGIKPRRSLGYYFKVYSFKLSKRLMYLVYGREEAERRLDRKRAKAGSSDYASASPMMRRILSKVVNEDLTSVLASIKAPTLLVWGENDTATPLADARKMEKLIPDAGLVSFAGCGHYSFLDNQHGFSAVLTSFLKSE